MSSTSNQKVAVITGASQGIGAGLVEGYRKQGYAVVATSRGIAPAEESDLLTVRGDIADPATGERVIAAAVERFGRVDTLVNNAGVFLAKPFTEFTAQDYELVLGVNLGGFFRITQLAVEQMLAVGGGHIVQISTSLVDHANSAVPSVLASLTKGGLQSATKALAIEYASRAASAATPSPWALSRPRCTRSRATRAWPGCTRSAAWARSATWSRRCSTSSAPPSSPAT
jgi:NAD(P)-dependent dehydrogenase (short-subunit alcohol dehydrogenase family)